MFGLFELFDGFGFTRVFLFPITLSLYLPQWVEGTSWLVLALHAIHLLVLMEVADRLSLKSDLEIARDIQIAMLPRGPQQSGGTSVFGFTRPANTVGGDFYDILPLADGRLIVAVGDVSGKGSPAALLMALLLAMPTGAYVAGIAVVLAPLAAGLMCQMSAINQLLGKKWWVGIVQAVAFIAVLAGAGVLFATCGVAPGFALTTVFLTVILFATQFWLVHPLARNWSEP